MKYLSFYLVVCVVCVVAVEDSLNSPQVTVIQGQLEGSWMRTRAGRRVAAFRGIPYAQPPVSELRFKSPQPVEPWNVTRSARADGNNCIQYMLGIIGDEDCLYLNIYSPNITGNLPVLFFIHGGAFKSGSGESNHYGPDYLLDEDLVLVAGNYRLGVFGFLSLEDAALPGNLGLKDQRAALRWVRDNIAQFGGDPARVTIFGESAGAQSVHYHMMFNTGEGLFRAGIMHSGSAYEAGAFQRPGEQRPLVDFLLSETSCAADDKTAVVQCLQKVQARQLIKLAEKHFTPPNRLMRNQQFGAVVEPDCVEDAFVTEDPWNRTTSLPLLIGTNQYEGLLYIYELFTDKSDKHFEEFDEKFEEIIPYNLQFLFSAEDPVSVANSLKHFYLPENKVDRAHVLNLTDMIGDGIFVYGSTEAVHHNLGETYLYSFYYLGSKSFSKHFGLKNTFGPSHAEELFLFFPFTSLQARLLQDPSKTGEDLELSRQLIKRWTHFITHLDPNAEGSSVEWTPVSRPEGLQNLFIAGPDNVSMQPEFLRERMHFWRQLPFRNKSLTDLQSCVA